MRRPGSAPGTIARAFVVCLCAGAAPSGQTNSSPRGDLALVGGMIYASPTEQPIPDGVVIVRSGKIAAVGRRKSLRIPADLERIDCSGLTITAGFWNSHVHFLQRKWADAGALAASELDRQLQDMLTQYGFTSVFDTWSMWENTRRIRDRIEAGELPGPRIRSTGESMSGKTTAPSEGAWGVLGFMPLEKFQPGGVADADEALEAAKKRLDAGTDGLKVYAMTFGRNSVAMPAGAIEAVVKEAHTRGRPVFAHPTTAAGLLASVRAGVDVIVHTTPQSGPWDESIHPAMKETRVALIPTLKLWKYELRHERAGLGEKWIDTAVGQLRGWLAAKGVALFGTDVGYMSEYDPTDEYLLMAEAGMSSSQILASLTTAPAERFSASTGLGRITPGLVADLTVLRGDPSKDVRAFATVQYTIRDGRIIFRRTERKPS